MFITKVQDLINALRGRNPEAQLFLMTQRKNPRENLLFGVVGREEMADQQYRLENGIRSDDVFLVVGRQLRVGSLTAWSIAENQPESAARDPETLPTWQIKLAEIAQLHLEVKTLNVRGSGALDYHQLHVAALRAALTAAYRAGVAAGIHHVVVPDDDAVPDEHGHAEDNNEHETGTSNLPSTAGDPAASAPDTSEIAPACDDLTTDATGASACAGTEPTRL